MHPAEVGRAHFQGPAELPREVTGVVEPGPVGDFRRAEGGVLEEVGSGGHAHTDVVGAGADQVGLMEFALELPDGEAGEFGQFVYIQGVREVLLDELSGGFNLQERLKEGLGAFITANSAEHAARLAVHVEDREFGGLVPDVLAVFVREEFH